MLLACASVRLFIEATLLTFTVFPDGNGVVLVGIAGVSEPLKWNKNENEHETNLLWSSFKFWDCIQTQKEITDAVPLAHPQKHGCSKDESYPHKVMDSMQNVLLYQKNSHFSKHVLSFVKVTFLWSPSAMTKNARSPMFIL